jgi:hypothetical protein
MRWNIERSARSYGDKNDYRGSGYWRRADGYPVFFDRGQLLYYGA